MAPCELESSSLLIPHYTYTNRYVQAKATILQQNALFIEILYKLYDMRYLIIILLLFVAFVSCERTGDFMTPIIPADDSIDIDNDMVYDFIVRYSSIATSDIPSSHQSITGVIKPLNDNKVLDRESVGNLFLKQGDTIRIEHNTNADWNRYAASVIGISGSGDKWNDEWRIASDLTNDFFIGVKLKKDGNIKVGWILLGLDKWYGSIRILDKELTSQPELIIHMD